MFFMGFFKRIFPRDLFHGIFQGIFPRDLFHGIFSGDSWYFSQGIFSLNFFRGFFKDIFSWDFSKGFFHGISWTIMENVLSINSKILLNPVFHCFMENYFLIKKYIFHKLGGIFSLIVDEFTLLPFLSALDLLLLFILKVWDFVCLRAFDLKPKGISRSKLFILFRMSGFFF